MARTKGEKLIADNRLADRQGARAWVHAGADSPLLQGRAREGRACARARQGAPRQAPRHRAPRSRPPDRAGAEAAPLTRRVTAASAVGAAIAAVVAVLV